METFAQFAMEKAPKAWPKDKKDRGHFYEVGPVVVSMDGHDGNHGQIVGTSETFLGK